MSREYLGRVLAVGGMKSSGYVDWGERREKKGGRFYRHGKKKPPGKETKWGAEEKKGRNFEGSRNQARSEKMYEKRSRKRSWKGSPGGVKENSDAEIFKKRKKASQGRDSW